MKKDIYQLWQFCPFIYFLLNEKDHDKFVYILNVNTREEYIQDVKPGFFFFFIYTRWLCVH